MQNGLRLQASRRSFSNRTIMGDWKGKSILVTGGAGFIGSHLVDSLLKAEAGRVVVVDNFFLGKVENLLSAETHFPSQTKVYREDAGDIAVMKTIFQNEKPEIVFNLATKALLYSFSDPENTFHVNVQIAQVLGEFLRKNVFEKLIHVSSSEVYGTAQHEVMSENHPLLAETSYAAGKAAADLFLTSYVNMFDLDIRVIRPFNNYGPRQNDGALAAVIPKTIKHIRKGQNLVIEGDGKQTRDFIFVEDTVRSLLELSKLPASRGKTVNLGSGKETTIKTIVETLCKIMGYKGSIQYVPERTADVRRHRADVSLAKSLIGEIQLTLLEEGLQKTVDWHQPVSPQ